MKNIIWIFVISFVIRFFISFVAWHPDVNNHIDWGIRVFEYGAKKVYGPDTNDWN